MINRYYRKTFTVLIFILVLSFAFYFALASMPVKAQTGTVIISNERASTITSTSATIRWTTNIQANSHVQGTGCSDPVGGCDITANNNTSEQVTAHVVSISGLRPGIRYTYWVSSKNNASGYIAFGSPQSFTTPGGATPIPTRTIAPTPTSTIQPFPSVTGGAGGGNDLPGIDLTIQDVFDIIYGFACWLWSVAMILLVIFIIISGVRFMYAGADPTKLTNAKQNFKYVIIGAIVVMGTFVIIATVAYNIGGNVSFIPFDCSGGSGNIEPEPSVTPTATPLSCVEYCQQAAEDVCSAAGGDYQQCYDEEYQTCVNQECVGGSIEVSCSVNPSQCHLECQNNTCRQVQGVGANSCASKGGTCGTSYCGDGTCDANAGETASSCPSDCP